MQYTVTAGVAMPFGGWRASLRSVEGKGVLGVLQMIAPLKTHIDLEKPTGFIKEKPVFQGAPFRDQTGRAMGIVDSGV